jgi:hypothetical protein
MNPYFAFVTAILACVGGVLLGRAVGLSTAITVTLGGLPTFLLLFPLVNRAHAKIPFVAWLLAGTISTIAAWLLYWAFA